MTTLCTSVLSDMGVLGSIEVQEFQLGLIPLEKDLLSLEYDDVYRKLFLVGSCISSRARAQLTLASALGWRLFARLRHGQGAHDDSTSLWRHPSYHWQGRLGQGELLVIP